MSCCCVQVSELKRFTTWLDSDPQNMLVVDGMLMFWPFSVKLSETLLTVVQLVVGAT